jgi:hypothetical protein
MASIAQFNIRLNSNLKTKLNVRAAEMGVGLSQLAAVVLEQFLKESKEEPGKGVWQERMSELKLKG